MTFSSGGEPDAAVGVTSERPDRTSLRSPVAAAGALALLAFTVVLLWPGGNLLRADSYGQFYDTQARALLDGHWDVDPSIVTIEGFSTDSGTQIYFGPVPAIARMPIVAVTDRFDGRLTRPSMILADAVLLVALVRLADWLARMLAPSRRIRRTQWLHAFTVFSLGTSIPLVVASWAWVYNEAIMWAIALATCALWLMVAHLVTNRRRTLVVAAVLATLTLLTRVSVGIGPIAALGLLGVTRLWPHRRSFWRPDGDREVEADRRRALATLVVGVVTVLVAGGLYVSVNLARFGTPLRVPYERQVYVLGDRNRRAALDANGGNLSNPAYLPTQLLQAVRPDAIRFRSQFPYVGIPYGKAPLVVPATFEHRRLSNSLFVSAPVPFVLAVVGAVVILAPRRRFRSLDPHRRKLAPLLAGSAMGTVGFLTFADIAPRYLGDAIPLMAIASLAAGAALTGRSRPDNNRRVASSSLRMGAISSCAGLLAIGGVWVNSAFAMELRFDRSANAPFTETRSWAALQLDVSRWTGDYPPAWVQRAITRRPTPGSLAVIGDCAGLYRANALGWTAIEGAPGASEAVVKVPARGAGGRALLLSKQDERGEIRMYLDPLGEDTGMLRLESRFVGRDTTIDLGKIAWAGRHRPRLHVLLDPTLGNLRILLDGDAIAGLLTYVPGGKIAAGPGVELEAAGARICPQLDAALRRAGR